MKKYWLIIKNTWDEYTAYRLNFILWRVRMVIRFLIIYFLWSAIFFTDEHIFFGYNRTTMLTYVVLVYIVGNFVFATRTQDIGSEINEGKLTNILLRPINYFYYVGARDLSDKIINFAFTIIETVILLVIFRPPLFFQADSFLLLLFLLTFLGSIFLYFNISALLGFIGFWTSEVWATRFIFIILLDFLAGTFLPIDIYPPFILRILSLTPFPYIIYFPVKIYLGQLSFNQMMQGLLIMTIWMIILITLVLNVWKKGLRVYGAEGR